MKFPTLEVCLSETLFPWLFSGLVPSLCTSLRSNALSSEKLCLMIPSRISPLFPHSQEFLQLCFLLNISFSELFPSQHLSLSTIVLLYTVCLSMSVYSQVSFIAVCRYCSFIFIAIQCFLMRMCLCWFSQSVFCQCRWPYEYIFSFLFCPFIFGIKPRQVGMLGHRFNDCHFVDIVKFSSIGFVPFYISRNANTFPR